MIILGAKGHSTEIVDILEQRQIREEIYFYDDISKNIEVNSLILNKYKIITNLDSAKNIIINSPHFALGTGNPKVRNLLFNKFKSINGVPCSVIANNSSIGKNNIILGEGINIMQFAFISSNVIIGDGTLVNARSNIHHDVKIGNFVEICPSVTLTGGVEVGNLSYIGAGAIILPNLKIGENSIIGAGSVVTKNIPDNCIAYGNPAIIKKHII